MGSKESKREAKSLSRHFWNSNPCGGSWSSVEEQSEWRYKKEPWIPQIIKNLNLSDRKVLEIGCGPGLDTLLLAKEARKVIGIDITENSIRLASEKIKRLNCPNIDLILADAEELPIKENSIDVVYSYGVLDHTPDITAAFEGIYKVLKSDGYGAVMMYRKYTIQSTIVSLIRSLKSFYGEYKLSAPKELNPTKGTAILELLHCPVLNKYSKREVKKIFSHFDIKIECYQTGFSRLIDFLPRRKCFFFNAMKKFLWWLEKITHQYWGFYMIVYFRKIQKIK